jgi:hypothetical protein
MTLRNTLAAIAAFLTLAGTSQAQTYTWDPSISNGTSPGGSGTWVQDNTTLNWFFVNNVAWGTGGFTAEFGGTMPGTVTVSGAITGVNGINFLTSGYTISGGTSLTLTGNAVNVQSGSTQTISTAARSPSGPPTRSPASTRSTPGTRSPASATSSPPPATP